MALSPTTATANQRRQLVAHQHGARRDELNGGDDRRDTTPRPAGRRSRNAHWRRRRASWRSRRCHAGMLKKLMTNGRSTRTGPSRRRRPSACRPPALLSRLIVAEVMVTLCRNRRAPLPPVPNPLHAAWASGTGPAPDAGPASPSPSLPRDVCTSGSRGPDIQGQSAPAGRRPRRPRAPRRPAGRRGHPPSPERSAGQPWRAG